MTAYTEGCCIRLVCRLCISAGLLRPQGSASQPGPGTGETLVLALLLCAFVALPNLSLEFNSAGTSLLLRYVPSLTNLTK